MAYDISNALYPRPAYKNNGVALTAQATTVTAGAATVVGFNLTPPNAAQLVYLDVAGDPVRAFWEGSVPTATSGHLLLAGTNYVFPIVAYNNMQVIFKTGSTASVVTATPMVAG